MHSSTMHPSIPMPENTHFVPTRILEIELGQPLVVISTFDEKTQHIYQRANCLVRLHTQPLGVVELELGEHGLQPEEYIPFIWQSLASEINAHLRQDGLTAVARLGAVGLLSATTPACLVEREKFLLNAPFVSIIVATHDRPERILTCLQALLNLDYPRYEIIVVDNAPSTEETATVIQQMYGDNLQVRYVRENRPGLSWARNCGMGIARGEIVAITDDDVLVDRYWLLELVKGFNVTDDVVCVTGLVLPLELEAAAQFLLEEYGGFSKGFVRRVFDLRKKQAQMPLHPYTSGRMGTGASLAFKTAYLRSIGGFDPALGTGTPALGGEDLAIFFQVVKYGHKLVYEPAALLYHPHRRDYASLQKQMYNYGASLTAYLTKIVLDNPLLLLDIASKILAGFSLALDPTSAKNSRKSAHYPKELTISEQKGMLYGPWAYIHSRYMTYRRYKKYARFPFLPTAEKAVNIADEYSVNE